MREMSGGMDVRNGWEVYSADDQKIGTVAEACGEYLRIEKGFLFKKDVYVPASVIRDSDPTNERVYLTTYKDQVESMGWDQPPGDAGTSSTGMDRVAADRTAESHSVQLREEELQARRNREQTGEVEVGKRVVSEQQTLDVPVTHEEVHIERRRIQPRLAENGISEEDQQTIRVPVNEEHVEVEKRPVVTEEINIKKTPVTENKRITDTVHREEPVINKDGGVTDRTQYDT